MSECYCDFDPADVYIVTQHRAKKLHKCCECASGIRPGESYTKIFVVYDGSADSYKRCERCIAVLRYVKAHLPCFCDVLLNLYGRFWGGENGADEAVKAYQHEVPGMGMEYGRLRVAVKRAPSYANLVFVSLETAILKLREAL